MTRWFMRGGVARWVGLALGAALLLAAVVLAWQGGQRFAPQGSTPGAAGNAAAAGALRWQVGTAQRYLLTLHSTLEAGAAGAPTVVRLQAGLNMRTLARGADGVRVGLQFDDVVLEVDGQRDAGRESALGTALRVHFTPEGMPRAFEFAAGLDTAQRTMLENLVRTFQLTVRPGEPAWQVQERGVSGAYVAQYRRTAPLELRKSKGGFDAPAAGPMAGATLASSEVIRLDPQHDWLRSMTVEETLRGGSQGPMPLVIHQRAALTLQPAARVTVSPAVWDFVAATAAAPRQAALPVPRMTAAAARAEILSRVDALDSERAQRTTHIRRLGALVRVDPLLPAVIVDRLRSGGLEDHTRAELFLVLEMAGTAPAQAALASVTQDAVWSVADRSRAIVALGGLDSPQPEVVDTLWALAAQATATGDAGKLAGDAMFALGRVARGLREAGHPDYPALRQRLLGGALAGGSAPGEDRQRANQVLALGNSGDASLTDDVAGLLADDSAVVRRAAAQALGALATDAAAERMLAQYGVESSGQVRGAIAESLQQWSAPTPLAMQTLRRALPREPDERARHGIATLLGMHLRQHPDNAAALRELLRVEPSRRIRQAAADALAEAGRP